MRSLSVQVQQNKQTASLKLIPCSILFKSIPTIYLNVKEIKRHNQTPPGVGSERVEYFGMLWMIRPALKVSIPHEMRGYNLSFRRNDESRE